jgi:hypothetical protein
MGAGSPIGSSGRQQQQGGFGGMQGQGPQNNMAQAYQAFGAQQSGGLGALPFGGMPNQGPMTQSGIQAQMQGMQPQQVPHSAVPEWMQQMPGMHPQVPSYTQQTPFGNTPNDGPMMQLVPNPGLSQQIMGTGIGMGGSGQSAVPTGLDMSQAAPPQSNGMYPPLASMPNQGPMMQSQMLGQQLPPHMPQAPMTQQVRPEGPRMQAMRNMQRFGGPRELGAFK